MKRNNLRIFGCCLITALLGFIGGGVIVAVAAWVLPKIMSGIIHKMRECMQECDCECNSEICQKMMGHSKAVSQ